MKVLATVVAVVCAFFGTALAQTPIDTIKVQFDRPVLVAGTELPAGHYTIQVLTAGGGGSAALALRSDSGAETTSVLVNRLHSADPNRTGEASVTLVRQGNQYRLDRVWVSQYIGFQLSQ